MDFWWNGNWFLPRCLIFFHLVQPVRYKQPWRFLVCLNMQCLAHFNIHTKKHQFKITAKENFSIVADWIFLSKFFFLAFCIFSFFFKFCYSLNILYTITHCAHYFHYIYLGNYRLHYHLDCIWCLLVFIHVCNIVIMLTHKFAQVKLLNDVVLFRCNWSEINQMKMLKLC